MNTKDAYNSWALQYDSNDNKTRDLEAIALRNALVGLSFNNVLEIGCGTGKNTIWFSEKAKQVTAVDQSEEMIAKAKEKIVHGNVDFLLADITKPWTFVNAAYDLISFSLVLEHIKELDLIFKEASAALQPGGHVYIGELHPFKQYSGTKARFETAEGLQIVDCYDHHISDFIQPAKKYGLLVEEVQEYFDDNDRKNLPRILVMLFRKTL